MGRIPQNIKTRINLNKHLEKSKCFFRAQTRKGILMNKYKKLIELIEENGLEIQSKKCYDPQSAWHGEELWIVDKKTRNKIFDLSGNGYCFDDKSVDKAIEEVEKYLEFKNMNAFDDFKKWVEKNAKPQK